MGWCPGSPVEEARTKKQEEKKDSSRWEWEAALPPPSGAEVRAAVFAVDWLAGGGFVVI